MTPNPPAPPPEKKTLSIPPLRSLFNQQWTKLVCSFQALICANWLGAVEFLLHIDYLLLVH